MGDDKRSSLAGSAEEGDRPVHARHLVGEATSKEAEALREHGQALIRMGREVLSRAAALAGDLGAASEAPTEPADILALAKAAHRDRRRRADFFPDDLFGEPAWDILLDVFIQEQIGKPLSVMASYIGSAASTGTAYRYVRLLMREGLIERTGDPNDNRRSFVTLTAQAREAMIDYLRTATVGGRPGSLSDRERCN